MIVVAYLAAITAANLLAARFGPLATIPIGFVLIGFDLVCRDTLHERWHRRQLWPKMAALILAGSALAWLTQPTAGRVAVASAAAFAVASAADAVVYACCRNWTRRARSNASNVVAAAVDSLVFPTLAFGVVLPWITAGQFAAKTVGALAWTFLLIRPRHSTTLSRRSA